MAHVNEQTRDWLLAALATTGLPITIGRTEGIKPPEMPAVDVRMGAGQSGHHAQQGGPPGVIIRRNPTFLLTLEARSLLSSYDAVDALRVLVEDAIGNAASPFPFSALVLTGESYETLGEHEVPTERCVLEYTATITTSEKSSEVKV